MPLERYEQAGFLFNKNFRETTSAAGGEAYRGELVLIEGEIADAQGRRKPPTKIVKQAVLLADGGKLGFFAGSLDDVALLPVLLEKYQADLAPGSKVFLFVVNIAQAVALEIGGASFFLIPLQDGMVWNELVDLTALEKSDLKGLSSSDKVRALADALSKLRPKYAASTLDAALASRTEAKRVVRGPV